MRHISIWKKQKIFGNNEQQLFIYLLGVNEKRNYLQKHTKYKAISFEKEN